MIQDPLVRALIAQVDVNFALIDTVLQIMATADLPASSKLNKALNEAASTNSKLIEVVKGLMETPARG